jgi:Tol biopolymer transport system component
VLKEQDGNSNIYIVSADGGPPKSLTNGHAVENDQEWSRDGIWIYYASNASGRSEIWKIPAAGGTPRRLTTDGGFEPREAPDGRTIKKLTRALRDRLIAQAIGRVTAHELGHYLLNAGHRDRG